MQKIRLSDLFACDEGGTMLVAEDRATGQPIHIAYAMRGLRCDCVCPFCRRPLVARKGSRRHSFAHYPEDVQRSCVAAGESLLHRYAKELLSREKYLLRPEMATSDALGALVLKSAGKVFFDRVELEQNQGNVIPDVVCFAGERRLFVEFKVSHAVDDVKRRKLRDHRASVIEIDLSGYRDLDLNSLDRAILEGAPRKMLQSEILDNAPSMLERRRQEKLQAIRSAAAPLVEVSRRRFRKIDVQSEQWYNDSVRYGVKSTLIRKAYANSPFLLHDEDWQLWTTWRLLKAKEGFTARQIAYEMMGFGWMKPRLYQAAEEVCSLIRAEMEPGFKTATEAVQDYLELMRDLERVYGRNNNRFYIHGSFRHWFEGMLRSVDAPYRRREELRHIVANIIKLLPRAESRLFNFDQWLDRYVERQGCKSWRELCAPDCSGYDILKQLLGALRAEFGWKQPDFLVDTLGLPIEAFLEGRRQAWTLHQEERRRRAEEQALVDADRRVQKLQHAAEVLQRNDVMAWLRMALEFEEMRISPLEHARRSPPAAAEMHRLLDLKRMQYEDRERYERAKADNQATLLTHAIKALGSEERARVWFGSHLRDLGMRRPADHCVDDKSLTECLNLLPVSQGR